MVLSWCFSDLLTSFRDFLADDSGYVQPREGLGLGWVAGALAALAVLFHAPAAQANDPCAGLAHGECGYACDNTFWECDKDTFYEREYCRTGDGQCVGPLSNGSCICA